MWATELRSIDHQLGIRQIGKPGALRTLEVFAAFPVEADQVLHAAEEVGKRLLEAYERPPENPAEVLARYGNGEASLDPLREFTEACRLERAGAFQQV